MKIICIGKNYLKHVKEFDGKVPEELCFFMKPDTALLKDNEAFYHPDFSKEIHHEVEIVVKIDKVGKNIQKQFAHKYYSEIGIGIDFTARDLQWKLKEQGLPWEKSKAFDNSAPIGKKFIPVSSINNLNNLNFHLDINGKTVQKGNTSDMMFKINDIIAEVSKYITLKTGDLIYTGTPEGVSPVKIGDNLKAYFEGECLLDFDIK
jgi:2-keto-4-pentenoate hydratase/2-oxohepta-3-ene-1,7-dioic acid hydratase in catechol pathway